MSNVFAFLMLLLAGLLVVCEPTEFKGHWSTSQVLIVVGAWFLALAVLVSGTVVLALGWP